MDFVLLRHEHRPNGRRPGRLTELVARFDTERDARKALVVLAKFSGITPNLWEVVPYAELDETLRGSSTVMA